MHKINYNTSPLLLSAQIVSALFSPLYMPVIAFIVLFVFSYLNLLPFLTKFLLTLTVYLFTVLIPYVGIQIYRKVNGWTRHQLSQRERRYVPYYMGIVSYATLLYIFYYLHMPRFTLGIIVAALLIQAICIIVNSFIKVSTHAAASGGVIGALMAFSIIFSFDPTSWLCLAILLCGCVCSARLIVRQHTHVELAWGVGIGIVSSFFSILLI